MGVAGNAPCIAGTSRVGSSIARGLATRTPIRAIDLPQSVQGYESRTWHELCALAHFGPPPAKGQANDFSHLWQVLCSNWSVSWIQVCHRP